MARPALVAALALVALSPAALADATLQHYQLLPGEHDDQGRVDEPDFAATGVLGPVLRNCVASLAPLVTPGLGRACVPDDALPAAGGQARAIAPGCTDDQGRQPSGLCALWSSGLHTRSPQPGAGEVYLLAPGQAGIAGMGGNAAPGRLTPTKGDAVRFLDLQYAASIPAGSMVEANRKLDDAGLRALAAGAVPEAAGTVVPVAASLWAWYGVWQDKNGNGVVDHLGDPHGQALPGNEFRWVGGCGNLGAAVCLREPGLVMPVWIFPGNHHHECGFLIGCYVLPADLPGRQAVCFAGFHLIRDPRLFNCLPAGDFDGEERTADPLLGPGEARVSADGELRDGTAAVDNQDPAKRGWFYGLVPGYYYDQSLLTTTLVVGGPTLRHRDPGLAHRYDLDALQFVDVDRHAAWFPAAGDLLHATLLPAARSPWVGVRDAYEPLGRTADGLVHHAALDAPAQALVPWEDALRDPGWSREPNHPLDRYPGAVHRAFAPGGDLPGGEQAHRGWLNDYAPHAGSWRAWADLRAERITFTYGRFSVLEACAQPFCQPGGGYWESWSLLPAEGRPFPRAPGDHGRSLDPGAYQFRGYVGAWRDQPREVVERTVDLAASAAALQPVVVEARYTLPPDGWIGDIVATTGAHRYRGYGEASCFLHGQAQVRAWAVCHPYLDAATSSADSEAGLDQSFGADLGDPQDYGDAVEFQGLTAPPLASAVVLRPASGVWSFPVLVWRNFYDWRVGDTAVLHDLTNSAQPIRLAVLPQLSAALRSRVVTQDVLVLPLGNLGQDVTMEFAYRVAMSVPSRGIALDEVVVDVDHYRAWGVPG